MTERLTETRRRLALDAMAEAEWRLSDTSMRSVLARIHSPSTSIEDVRADMLFLERHGLVSIDRMQHAGRELWVAQATSNGQAVARGRNHVGIAERDA